MMPVQRGAAFCFVYIHYKEMNVFLVSSHKAELYVSMNESIVQLLEKVSIICEFTNQLLNNPPRDMFQFNSVI